MKRSPQRVVDLSIWNLGWMVEHAFIFSSLSNGSKTPIGTTIATLKGVYLVPRYIFLTFLKSGQFLLRRVDDRINKSWRGCIRLDRVTMEVFFTVFFTCYIFISRHLKTISDVSFTGICILTTFPFYMMVLLTTYLGYNGCKWKGLQCKKSKHFKSMPKNMLWWISTAA